MKKKHIIGMMIVASMLSFNAFAGMTVVKNVKEVIVEYMKKMDDFKAAVKNGKIKASSLETADALKEQDKVMDNLGLTNKDKNTLRTYISSGNVLKVDVIGTLNVLWAAKKGTVGKTDAEAVSISSFVDSAIKFLTNVDLIGEKKSSTKLSEAEFKETAEALNKLVTILDNPLSYEIKERDNYTAMLNKLSENALTAESINLALVEAVMATAKGPDGKVGVSKEKAMEIIRNIINCLSR